MRVTCDHCAQALAIPDEKVPNRAFSLTCPKCKGTIKVDPTAKATAPAPADPAEPTETEPAPSAPATTAPVRNASTKAATPKAPPSSDSFAPNPSPTPAPAPGVDVNDFAPLHVLRPVEQDLLDRVIPLVFLVGFTDTREDERITAGLERLGWDTLERHASLEDAVQAMATAAPGIAIVRRDQRATLSDPTLADPALVPLGTLASGLRRSVFVAVLADGVHALDGQLAFLLQVDCVLDAGALYRFPVDLRRAVLARQQRYRHWHLDDD